MLNVLEDQIRILKTDDPEYTIYSNQDELIFVCNGLENDFELVDSNGVPVVKKNYNIITVIPDNILKLIEDINNFYLIKTLTQERFNIVRLSKTMDNFTLIYLKKV